MIKDFYSNIDLLIHPVGPGREGTSNVIMEALALGVPVLTTTHAGLHGELLVDGKNALIATATTWPLRRRSFCSSEMSDCACGWSSKPAPLPSVITIWSRRTQLRGRLQAAFRPGFRESETDQAHLLRALLGARGEVRLLAPAREIPLRVPHAVWPLQRQPGL